MLKTDAVVIGAGVIGLAAAAALARRGFETLVLDAADGFGGGVSSRNSEVIHAGLYGPPDSLKRRLCIRGRRQLYDYLASRGVAHKKVGKLVVATSNDQCARLEALCEEGRNGGVESLALLSGRMATELEPALSCELALSSGETGILDSHGLMIALLGEVGDHGGSLALRTPVERVEATAAGFLVHVGGDEPVVVHTRVLVNAGGLSAPGIARSLAGLEAGHVPQQYLAKGSYFACTGRPAFSRLIYPLPVPGGLGVHLTLDLAGRMRFGPDVEWLEISDPSSVDFRVDPARSESFYDEIRRYWPGLPEGALSPDYAGCRPKLSGPGAVADFRIDGPERHGLEGLVNLFGIESPGLTSALAIADEVVSLIK